MCIRDRIDGDVLPEAVRVDARVLPAVLRVALYPKDRDKVRPLTEIPREILDSRGQLQQQLSESTEIDAKEFSETARERAYKVQQWFS